MSIKLNRYISSLPPFGLQWLARMVALGICPGTNFVCWNTSICRPILSKFRETICLAQRGAGSNHVSMKMSEENFALVGNPNSGNRLYSMPHRSWSKSWGISGVFMWISLKGVSPPSWSLTNVYFSGSASAWPPCQQRTNLYWQNSWYIPVANLSIHGYNLCPWCALFE